VNTWTVSEARGELPQILAKVAHGEEVTLTKHGRPIAVIVRPDTLRARRAGDALAYFLARLDLRPVDQATAELAVVIGARYGLKPVDAIHLATALLAGADRFITTNRRDFRAAAIAEIAVTHPEDLPPPRGAGRLR
jgi:antitoxin (DNA-binding transcriptional repressor) of toxin-antitoxin stability system